MRAGVRQYGMADNLDAKLTVNGQTYSGEGELGPVGKHNDGHEISAGKFTTTYSALGAASEAEAQAAIPSDTNGEFEGNHRGRRGRMPVWISSTFTNTFENTHTVTLELTGSIDYFD